MGGASSLVDLRGFEPLTPCMPCRCATSCATGPCCPSGQPVQVTTSDGPGRNAPTSRASVEQLAEPVVLLLLAVVAVAAAVALIPVAWRRELRLAVLLLGRLDGRRLL